MSLLDSLTAQMLWIPMISLLLYVPIVCYLDLKYREIEHDYWLPLIVMNVPTAIMLLWDGNGLLYIPGVVATMVWFMAMRFGMFEGADFIYLSLISLFFIYNPISGHWLMVLPFSIFLTTCLTITAGWILIYNMITKGELTLKFNKELPMMLPISAALILTVMLA
jgi:hypothetical protein